jgi:hypothetical protein
VPVLLILLGITGVVTAVGLLAGYPWAIGVLGALALIAGVLLYDPMPNMQRYQTKRGTR